MTFSTPKLDKAVAQFKNVCGAHDKLYKYGQFYVTRRTVDDVFSAIEVSLKANPRLNQVAGQPDGMIKFFFTNLSTSVEKVDVPRILAALDLPGVEQNGDMAFIRSLFKPSKADRVDAQADFDALWSRSDFPSAPLWNGGRTLFTARAARAIEHDRCWQVLRSFAKMHAKARGLGPPAYADQVSTPLLGGAELRDVAPNRQEVKYASPPALTAAADKMKKLCDDGFTGTGPGLVHCGVLSGATHNQPKFPQPEHHILVFGWDNIDGQDAFVFWDPDCTNSNIVTTGWGQGFGVLFSRPGRLCTGVDDADLAAVELDSNNPLWGDHTLNDDPASKRHCYQVYTVQSLPLPTVVRVHTKVMTPPAHASLDEMLDKAVWLYAAHGIELHEASRESFEAGSAFDQFQTLFVGDGATGPTTEVTEMYAALRNRRSEFGVEPRPTDAVVAFVSQLVPAARGSALSPTDQPGVVLSAFAAGDWTLAHEIGHLAGLEHVDTEGRLMFATTQGVDAPELTDEEAEAFRADPLALR